MASSPEIINLINDVLLNDPALAAVQEWTKANSLVTLASPGGSIGLEKEDFDSYTRENDEATAYINIVLWVKHHDPVTGEAQVRALAQAVRSVLLTNRTLGGLVDESIVKSIRYATAEGGKALLLHLAEIEYQVVYYAERDTPAEAVVIEIYEPVPGLG